MTAARRRKEGGGMHLTVLSVPGCPSVAVLEQRLARVLRGRPGITLARHEVADLDEAIRLGLLGSPTLLVDGIDPFAEPGQPASASCRLYRDGHGRAGAHRQPGRPGCRPGRPAWGIDPITAMFCELLLTERSLGCERPPVP
jgi:hypothetical protein